MNKSGFNRLRSVAAAGAMGIGAMAGGSVRAQSIATSSTFTINNVYYSYGFYTSDIRLGGSNVDALGLYYGIMTGLSLPTTGGSTYTSLTYGIYSGLSVAIDGTGYFDADGYIDYTGTTYTSSQTDFDSSELDVELQWHFFTGRQAIRLMVSLTNNVGSPRTSDVALGGTYGGSTAGLAGSSNGDATFDTSDYWYVAHGGVDSSGVAQGEAIKTIGRFGPNASVTPTNDSYLGGSSDAQTDVFSVTVQPGETVRLLLLYDMNTNTTEALSKAADFESLDTLASAGLLTGLSSGQQAEIVNYGRAGPGPANAQAVPIPHLWLSYFLVPLVGLFGLHRRKKKLATV